MMLRERVQFKNQVLVSLPGASRRTGFFLFKILLQRPVQ